MIPFFSQPCTTPHHHPERDDLFTRVGGRLNSSEFAIPSKNVFPSGN
jgi:hypothetical protein